MLPDHGFVKMRKDIRHKSHVHVIFFLVQKSPLFYEHAPQLDLAVDARYLPDVHITHFQKMSPTAITNMSTCSLHLTQPDPSLDHTMARLGPVGSTSRLSRSCPPCRRTSCLDHISRPAPRPIAGGHHQLVHEVDDGSRWLVQIQLRKNVALKYFWSMIMSLKMKMMTVGVWQCLVKKGSFLRQIPYYGDDREMKGMTAEKL